MHRFTSLQEVRSDLLELKREGDFGAALDALEKGTTKAVLDYHRPLLELHNKRVLLFDKNAYYFDDDLRTTIENSIDTIDKDKSTVMKYLLDNVDKKKVELPSEIVDAQIRIFKGLSEFEKFLENSFGDQLSRIKSQF